MNKHFYQRKTGIGALALSLFLIISFLLSPFMFPVSMSNRLAKAETGMQATISSYLPGYDITDEEMDENAERIMNTYSQYVEFDGSGNYLRLSTEAYAHFGNTEAIEVYDYNFDDTNFTDEQLIAIGEIRMIYYNIEIMNQLVENELGYIDSNGEFVFTEFDNTMLSRWACWGFSLKWYKLSVNFDSDWAILFSILALIAGLWANFDSLDEYLCEAKSATTVEESIELGCKVVDKRIQNIIKNFFSDDAISEIIDLTSMLADVIRSASVVNTVLTTIFKYVIPDLEDSIIVLYKASKFGYGVKLTICWVPVWGQKWGLSIKPITQ